MLIAELNSPDTCACASIKNPPELVGFASRRQVELIVLTLQEEVVLKVCHRHQPLIAYQFQELCLLKRSSSR
jgi:hypothetical protein